MRLSIFLAVTLLTVPSYAADEKPPPGAIFSNHCHDVSEIPGPLVKTSADAIRIAHALWQATEPNISDEKDWQAKFTAALEPNLCVWEVSEKPTPDNPDPAFFIGVGATDGRFIGAVMLL